MTPNSLTASEALLYLSMVRKVTMAIIESAPVTAERLGGQKFVAARLQGASSALAPLPKLSQEEWSAMAGEHAGKTLASMDAD